MRIKNQLVPGVEGGVTVHMPSGEQMSIYDAAMKYKAAGVPSIVLRGKELRHRFLAGLGWQGPGAARRARGARGRLRAHPPLELVGMGVFATAVP
ncbi:MAG: hypothetical protein R3F17_01995 [Planctomycetota bacterium]